MTHITIDRLSDEFDGFPVYFLTGEQEDLKELWYLIWQADTYHEWPVEVTFDKPEDGTMYMSAHYDDIDIAIDFLGYLWKNPEVYEPVSFLSFEDIEEEEEVLPGWLERILIMLANMGTKPMFGITEGVM